MLETLFKYAPNLITRTHGPVYMTCTTPMDTYAISDFFAWTWSIAWPKLCFESFDTSHHPCLAWMFELCKTFRVFKTSCINVVHYAFYNITQNMHLHEWNVHELGFRVSQRTINLFKCGSLKVYATRSWRKKLLI